MIRTTSKTINRWLERNPEKAALLESIHYEPWERLWFAYAKYGYWFPRMECGTAVEPTIKELLAMISTIERNPNVDSHDDA